MPEVKIEWKEEPGGFSEPSGRFFIKRTPSRHYHLLDGGEVVKRGKLHDCRAFAETVAVVQECYDSPPPAKQPVLIPVPSDGELLDLVRNKETITDRAVESFTVETLPEKVSYAGVPLGETPVTDRIVENLPAVTDVAPELVEAMRETEADLGQTSCNQNAPECGADATEEQETNPMAKRESKKARTDAAKADVAAKVRDAKPLDNDRLTWILDPVEEKWGAASVLRWETDCGRYYLYRVDSSTREGVAWGGQYLTAKGHKDAVETITAKNESPKPRYHKTAKAALEAVKAFHNGRANTEAVTNAAELLDRTECLEAFSPKEHHQTEEHEEGTMKVKEKAARKMLTAMGYKMAAKDWSVKKLLAQLSDPAGLQQDADEVGGEDKALFNRISEAVSEGKEVLIVAEGGEIPAEKAKPTSAKGKPAAANGKAPKRKKAVEGNGQELDKFGTPLDSNSAKVNKALNKTPKSFGEIVKETGLTKGQVRYSHLDGLVKSGFVVRTPEGWALKK